MSTNYYARYNICEGCGRYDEEHISKSSGGWTFTFHATEEIRSYGAWLDFLSQKDVEIFDEFGCKISRKDFHKLVLSKMDEPYNHAKEHPDDGSYLDEDGNSMSPYEFS